MVCDDPTVGFEQGRLDAAAALAALARRSPLATALALARSALLFHTLRLRHLRTRTRLA